MSGTGWSKLSEKSPANTVDVAAATIAVVLLLFLVAYRDERETVAIQQNLWGGKGDCSITSGPVHYTYATRN